MRYSKLLIAVAAFATFNLASAQEINGFDRSAAQYDLALFQNAELTLKSRVEPINVDGTPFMWESFQDAEVYFRKTDQEAVRLPLNYNVYANMMKIQVLDDDEDKIRVVPRTSDIDIAIDGKFYRYLEYEVNGEVKSGYIRILQEFENEDLIAMVYTKEIMEPEPGNSYSAPKNSRFRDSEQILFIDNEGYAFEMKNNKKRAYKDLPTMQDEVKEYIKKNNIKFEDDYRGLIGVARFYSINRK